MSIKSTLHFNEGTYRDKISKDDTNTLLRKHSVKTMRYSACVVGTAVGIGAAIVTGGITVIAPIYTGRQGVINRKQQEVIEGELARRGVATPRLRMRDAALGASIAGATALVGYGIAPVVIDHLATAPLIHLASSAVHGALPAADYIAHTGIQELATPHATHVAGHEAVQAVETFGQGIQYTFVTQAHQAAAPFVHHTMNTAINSVPNNGPFYALGVQAVTSGEDVATSIATNYGLGRAGTHHIQSGKRRDA